MQARLQNHVHGLNDALHRHFRAIKKRRNVSHKGPRVRGKSACDVTRFGSVGKAAHSSDVFAAKPRPLRKHLFMKMCVYLIRRLSTTVCVVISSRRTKSPMPTSSCIAIAPDYAARKWQTIAHMCLIARENVCVKKGSRSPRRGRRGGSSQTDSVGLCGLGLGVESRENDMT